MGKQMVFHAPTTGAQAPSDHARGAVTVIKKYAKTLTKITVSRKAGSPEKQKHKRGMQNTFGK